MTPSPSDSLVFKMSGDALIPYDAENVFFELRGEGASTVDPEFVRHVAAGVLDYFRHELKRTAIAPGEFAGALETALRGLGLTDFRVGSRTEASDAPLAETDLRSLVGEGLEIVFFQNLREELKRQLAPSVQVVRFHSLRPCVMELTGARRWSPRCQSLRDQIVEFLRNSLQTESVAHPRGLVVD